MESEPSSYQRKILAWLQDNHPTEWVEIGGVNLHNCRGLEKRGLVEIKGAPGKWKVRLVRDPETDTNHTENIKTEDTNGPP